MLHNALRHSQAESRGRNQNKMAQMVWKKARVTQACERVLFEIYLGMIRPGLFLEQSSEYALFSRRSGTVAKSAKGRREGMLLLQSEGLCAKNRTFPPRVLFFYLMPWRKDMWRDSYRKRLA